MIEHKFKIGDKVQVNFQQDRYLTCVIFALYFTELEVFYNLKVEGSDIELYSIPSPFIEEYGQVKPNVYYKTETIFDNKHADLNYQEKLNKVREIAKKYIPNLKLDNLKFPEQIKNQDQYNKNVNELNKLFKSDN